MTNKKLWLGMLAVALVFGMTVIGCGDDEDNPGDNPDEQARWTWVENNTDDPITKIVFTTESNGAGQIILTDNQTIPAHSKRVYDLGLGSIPGVSQGDHSWIWSYASVTVSGQVINSFDPIGQAAKYRDYADNVYAASLRKVGSIYTMKSEYKNYWSNKKAIDPLLIGKWEVNSFNSYEFTQNTFTNHNAGSTTNYSGVYSESIRIFYSSGQRIFSSWHVAGNTLTLTNADTSETIVCTKVP